MPDERSNPMFLSDFWAFPLVFLSILICIVVFITLILSFVITLSIHSIFSANLPPSLFPPKCRLSNRNFRLLLPSPICNQYYLRPVLLHPKYTAHKNLKPYKVFRREL